MKKHYGYYFLIFPISMLLLYMGAYLVEDYGIELIEGTTLWINVSATLLAGYFTLLGVKLTIDAQKKSEKLARQCEVMPLLGVRTDSVTMKQAGNVMIFSYTKEGKSTTAFPILEEELYDVIRYPILTLFPANQNPIFDLCAEDLYLQNGIGNGKSCCFYPTARRLLEGEEENILIYLEAVDQKIANHFGIVRFSYYDMYHQKYYQDIPFILSFLSEELQEIEIRDIKAPVVAGEKLTILESAKQFRDWSAFI